MIRLVVCPAPGCGGAGGLPGRGSLSKDGRAGTLSVEGRTGVASGRGSCAVARTSRDSRMGWITGLLVAGLSARSFHDDFQGPWPQMGLEVLCPALDTQFQGVEGLGGLRWQTLVLANLVEKG